ncbi:MAG: BamA/TamA family outer membrane protein, partial [Bacteroidota bacterium]
LTRDEWIQIAETMQHNITDEVIEKAIRSYPPEVFEKYGEETIEIMKVRRDKLAEVTRRFYDMIASVVSVPGSNKRERYIIDVLPEKRMRVRVFKITQKGKQKDKYYDRTFSAGETKEIRLYGMGGADEFTIRGDYSAGIKLIVVGGPGEDVFTDKTTVRRIKKAIELFDTKTGNEIPDTKNTHVHTSANPMINAYDYEGEFKWNRIALGGFFNYNNDDGVFIGGGPRFIRHGFRKQPASVEHYIRGNLAPLTGAANIRYSGDWYQIVGNWNARVDADVFFPESYQNFFGLGNETVETQENREFYRARFRGYSFEPKLNTTIRQQPMVNYFAGTRLSIFNVDDDPDRVTQIIQEGTSGNPFDEEWFGSVLTGFSVIDVDNLNNPKQGYQFRFLGEMNTGIENTSANFARIETSLSVYYSARFFPQITFANRTDFGHNIGDFPFYRASTIGGRQNMRGLRGTRFAGRTHLATNTEARIELFDFYRYVLGGKVGINPFFDVGRVWQDGEQSRIWHYAVGSGVWLNVFDVFLINASYGIAEDSSLFTITTGFFF